MTDAEKIDWVEQHLTQLTYSVEQRLGTLSVPSATVYVLLRLAGLPIPEKLAQRADGDWQEAVDAYIQENRSRTKMVEAGAEAMKPLVNAGLPPEMRRAWLTDLSAACLNAALAASSPSIGEMELRKALVRQADSLEGDFAGEWDDLAALLRQAEAALASKPLPPIDDVRVASPVTVEGSIYEGMAACLARDGKTIAHVPDYKVALEIAAALSAQSPPPAGDDQCARLTEAARERQPELFARIDRICSMYSFDTSRDRSRAHEVGRIAFGQGQVSAAQSPPPTWTREELARAIYEEVEAQRPDDPEALPMDYGAIADRVLGRPLLAPPPADGGEA